MSLYIIALTEVVKISTAHQVYPVCRRIRSGTYIGSFIEERVALGYVNVQIISMDNFGNLQTRLRNEGFGVTSFEGYAGDGAHNIINVLLKRRDCPK